VTHWKKPPLLLQASRNANGNPSQKIKQLAGGGIELSLTLSNLEEVERWILSWGTNARVLAPAELKERIAQTVSELAESELDELPRSQPHSSCKQREFRRVCDQD
jgi:predicted DNA-binding transcriptional regulator YafY